LLLDLAGQIQQHRDAASPLQPPAPMATMPAAPQPSRAPAPRPSPAAHPQALPEPKKGAPRQRRC
jgi:hypothetical protein